MHAVRTFLGPLVIAVLLIAPARATEPDPALVAAALQEGEVVWYSTLIVNQIVRPMVEAFEKL